MDSPNVQRVLEFLKSRRASYVSNVWHSPNSEGVVLLVRDSMIGKSAGKGGTSRRQLLLLQKAIQHHLGFKAELVISKGDEHENIEQGLLAFLKHRHPGLFENCFVSSISNDSIDVWLEPTAKAVPSSQATETKVSKAISDFLRLFRVRVRAIHWGDGGKDLPSLVAVLLFIKTHAPVAADKIADGLTTAGFQLPSKAWLQSKLDLLRRRGFAIRREDGCYAVSSTGLDLVPHSKTRSSSDVQRALALGRRKW